MFKSELCSLRRLLAEDFPGGHTYVHVCRNCGKEYGNEFTEYHHPTQERPSEAAPTVVPHACACGSARRPVSELPALCAIDMGVAYA